MWKSSTESEYSSSSVITGGAGDEYDCEREYYCLLLSYFEILNVTWNRLINNRGILDC